MRNFDRWLPPPDSDRRWGPQGEDCHAIGITAVAAVAIALILVIFLATCDSAPAPPCPATPGPVPPGQVTQSAVESDEKGRPDTQDVLLTPRDSRGTLFAQSRGMKEIYLVWAVMPAGERTVLQAFADRRDADLYMRRLTRVDWEDAGPTLSPVEIFGMAGVWIDTLPVKPGREE